MLLPLLLISIPSIIKMLHHVVDIIPTEAESFTIRYGINQAVQTQDVSYIINTIHVKTIRSGLSFYYFLFLFSYFLFIELRVRVDWSQDIGRRGRRF